MSAIESGRTGRIAYTRVRPNEDFVQAVEKVALLHGFRSAFVRGRLGILSDACLERIDGTLTELRGPAVEVLAPVGELRRQPVRRPQRRRRRHGGPVWGGRFLSGRNSVCITFELVLEEWLPDGPS
jgi:hypothetical protein